MRYVPLLLLLCCIGADATSRSDALGAGQPCMATADCPPGLVCTNLICATPPAVPDAGVTLAADGGCHHRHHDGDDPGEDEDDDDDDQH